LARSLADVVALSLSKRPETRYQDGDQFAAELRNAMKQVPDELRSSLSTSLSDDSKSGLSGAFAATVPATPNHNATQSDFMATLPATPTQFEKTHVQTASPPANGGSAGNVK
jgi:hypothetical protein